jgi:hypothetical protein
MRGCSGLLASTFRRSRVCPGRSILGTRPVCLSLLLEPTCLAWLIPVWMTQADRCPCCLAHRPKLFLSLSASRCGAKFALAAEWADVAECSGLGSKKEAGEKSADMAWRGPVDSVGVTVSDQPDRRFEQTCVQTRNNIKGMFQEPLGKSALPHIPFQGHHGTHTTSNLCDPVRGAEPSATYSRTKYGDGDSGACVRGSCCH